MKAWSLKVKFGAYAATLATVALLVGAFALIPIVSYQQLRELDSQLAEDAGEFFRDLENFRGAPLNPRHPLSAKFLPLSLQDRYILLTGPEGQILYESPNLNGLQLPPTNGRITTVNLTNIDLRLGSFQQSSYSLRVGANLEPLYQLRRDLFFGLSIAAPLTALFVFAGGFFLGKHAVAPISHLSAAAEKISANQNSDRLPMPIANDEIASLTVVLNTAFERLQNAYAAATRFSADASHQLKTPISVLQLGISALRENETVSKECGLEIESLLQQTKRLNALINDLLLLAQADSGRLPLEPETFDIVTLIAASVDDIEAIACDKDLTIECEIPETLMITADKRRLRIALQVLAENAAKYTPPKGTIRARATLDDNGLDLELSNTGAAIPEHEKDLIFERFRRSEAIGENISGHGLGLNIARNLMRSQNGDVCLHLSDGDWTVFKLSMPNAP